MVSPGFQAPWRGSPHPTWQQRGGSHTQLVYDLKLAASYNASVQPPPPGPTWQYTRRQPEEEAVTVQLVQYVDGTRGVEGTLAWEISRASPAGRLEDLRLEEWCLLQVLPWQVQLWMHTLEVHSSHEVGLSSNNNATAGGGACVGPRGGHETFDCTYTALL